MVAAALWAAAAAAASLARQGVLAPHEEPSSELVQTDTAVKTPKLINVGLVSTGTVSFGVACTHIGMRLLHTSPTWDVQNRQYNMMPLLQNAVNLSLTNPKGVLAQEVAHFDAFADVPYLAPEVINQADTTRHDKRQFVFIATNRSRKGWIASMQKNAGKGGVALRYWYGMTVTRKENCSSVVRAAGFELAACGFAGPMFTRPPLYLPPPPSAGLVSTVPRRDEQRLGKPDERRAW